MGRVPAWSNKNRFQVFELKTSMIISKHHTWKTSFQDTIGAYLKLHTFSTDSS